MVYKRLQKLIKMRLQTFLICFEHLSNLCFKYSPLQYLRCFVAILLTYFCYYDQREVCRKVFMHIGSKKSSPARRDGGRRRGHRGTEWFTSQLGWKLEYSAGWLSATTPSRARPDMIEQPEWRHGPVMCTIWSRFQFATDDERAMAAAAVGDVTWRHDCWMMHAKSDTHVM